MRHLLIALAFLFLSSVSTATDKGIVSKESQYSVAETAAKLETIVKGKGITLFAKIDHAAEAEKVDLKMRPAQLLVFGNPKGGTPIMNAAPLSGIDLPIKALIWQDAQGKVWLSYNSPAYLKDRHHLSDDVAKPLETLVKIMEQAVE